MFGQCCRLTSSREERDRPMRLGWRAISGPALTAATLLLAMFFDRFVPTLSPAPLLVCIVALAGALSGPASAVASAAIAVIGAALLLLSRHGVSGLSTADMIRLAPPPAAAAGDAAAT